MSTFKVNRQALEDAIRGSVVAEHKLRAEIDPLGVLDKTLDLIEDADQPHRSQPMESEQLAELTALRSLVKRLFPNGPSSLCSAHKGDKEFDCTVCYPNLWAIVHGLKSQLAHSRGLLTKLAGLDPSSTTVGFEEAYEIVKRRLCEVAPGTVWPLEDGK